MMCFNAKLQVQSEYQGHHERKLQIIPEDFALTINDLTERPDVMYDSNAMEKADWTIRPWDLTFEHETEAMGKLAERRREKQHSLRSEVIKRRGIRWCSDREDSPNWPLDETFHENGVSKHDMYEQWTPPLDHEVDYAAMNYLSEMCPELLQQLFSADSPVQSRMPEHLLENTSEWMIERMQMELHLSKARQAMRELDAVELIVARAANVIAELNWQRRDTDRFPFGPMAETKRLAITITQEDEHCADKWLIEALEKQRSRTVRSIVLEHEKRDFVGSWRDFHQFALAMFELLNAAGATVDSLASERSLVVRLEALEQQGIIPSYGHYGLEQHFDLQWRRARTDRLG